MKRRGSSRPISFRRAPSWSQPKVSSVGSERAKAGASRVTQPVAAWLASSASAASEPITALRLQRAGLPVPASSASQAPASGISRNQPGIAQCGRPRLPKMGSSVNIRMVGAASATRNRNRSSRPALHCVQRPIASGANTQGSSQPACASSESGASQGENPSPCERPAWNRNDAQPCRAFQTSTGETMAAASAAAAQGAGWRSFARPRADSATKRPAPSATSAP